MYVRVMLVILLYMYNNWIPLGVAVLATVLDIVVTELDIVVTEGVAVVVAMLDDVIAITKSKNTGVSIIIYRYMYVTS